MNQPHENVQQINIEPGMQVADLGCGSGFYAVAAGKMAGEKGKVFAIDIQKHLLDTTVSSSAKQHHLMNVYPVWGNAERQNGTRLRDDSIDVILVVNTLFQIDDTEGIGTEAARIAKPDAQLLIVDWTDSHGGMGPAPDDVVEYDTAREVFELAGFEHVRDIDTGEHHYGFVMRCSPGDNNDTNV
jgi:ubiquinone/menaquinone biosynthesis C-methylase UbiE